MWSRSRPPSHNADCEAAVARKQRLLEGRNLERMPALESGWEVVHGNQRKGGWRRDGSQIRSLTAPEAGSDEATELWDRISY